MPNKPSCCLIVLLLLSFAGFSQRPGMLLKKLDSLSRKTDAGTQKNDRDPEAYNETIQINVPAYFILLGSNFKQQVTSPFHTSKKEWIRAGKFALLTGAMAFADRPIQKQALKLRNNNQTISNISRYVTHFGAAYETYALASLAAYGLIFKNEKMKNTVLLATQAYITGGLVESIAKYATGRQRPTYYGTDSVEARPIFHGPFAVAGRAYNGRTISSSFPSGHTTVAFAAATVFAMEYKNKPFVPILAYAAATLVGVSRITENKHWATDVLVGAALGYVSGRQVVNNYHRYASIKNASQKPGTVSFNLQYRFGQWMPGVVYRF